MGVAGTICTRLWEHPFADVTSQSHGGAPALVTRLRATDRTRDPLLVARIEAVHRVLLRARVPHVLRVRSVEPAADDRLQLSYPAVQGEGLVNALRRGPLPLPRALAVLRQVCRSLTAAHAVGIEHHLLGPASIVFLRDDDPRSIGILDYGIAPLFDGDGESGALDLHPITPERVIGGGNERSEDVYLVGCLAYWMLAGEPPFRAEDLATLRRSHAIEDARRLDALPIVDVPEHIADAVAKALEKDPDDRFASIADFEAALEARTFDGVPTEVIADVASPPMRGVTAPRMPKASRRADSSGERRIITPALVFAPGRRSEGPRMRTREPTLEVEPASILRRTALAILAMNLPVRRDATPEQAAPTDRHRTWKASAALVASTLSVVAAIVAVSGEEPTRLSSMQVASVVAPRMQTLEGVPKPQLRAVDLDAVPLPPPPGATPPIENAFAVAEDEPAIEPAPLAAEPPRVASASHAREPSPRVAAVAATAEPAERCDLTRRAAEDARRAHDWAGLLRHTARASCWRSADERTTLRVKALMELGRFEECARLGSRVARPQSEVQLWTRVCSKRAETPT